MNNINTYLKWRGDLDFEERSFCDTDNIALAAFSYIQFEKIMPLCETQEPTIEQLFACYSREEIQIHFLGSEYPVLFELMAKSRRFGSTKILDWRAITDEQTNIQIGRANV